MIETGRKEELASLLPVSEQALERIDIERLLIAGFVVPGGDEEDSGVYFWTQLALKVCDEFWRQHVGKLLRIETHDTKGSR